MMAVEKELERFASELSELDEYSLKLENKEITAKEYKTVSCGFGNYMQRDGKSHMLRLRIPAGRMTKEMLECIVKNCKEYGVFDAKVSTGQTLQLHDLNDAAVRGVARAVLEAGIVTRGAGGNHPANVIASPLTGVEKGEYFDVMPYAEAVHEYVLSIVGILKFPRKLKISLSGSPKNETHATFRDLGFVANEDGTFDFYIAGGLGVNPMMGILAAEHLPGEKLLYYVRAMMNVFMENGDYEHRFKARTRYLQNTLGAETLKEMVLKEAERLMETEDLDLHVQPLEIQKKGAGTLPESFRITEQKQDGLYAVYYHPAGGFVKTRKLKKLYEAILPMEAVEIRLSPDGGMYFINCNAAEAQLLKEMTEEETAETKFETSISCVGRLRCAIGACNSQLLLEECIKRFKDNRAAMEVLPQMRISGCMSSCSAHQCAPLGFRGGMKKSDDGPKPAFCVFWGGCEHLGQEKLSESDTFIFADQIPDFLEELADTLIKEDTDYETWIEDHDSEMTELVNKYKIA